MGIFNNFISKKNGNSIYAPVNGFSFDICKSTDKTFADKMMGDGFGVVPTSKKICAPCNGTITMVFPTNHAFGIKMNDGTEILVHIGINTVELQGKCFKLLKDVNSSVCAGKPIVEFDYENAAKLGFDVGVYTIVINSKNISKINISKDVTIDDVIIEEKDENN